MMITGKTLFAFVDSQDPFLPSAIAGVKQPGTILSMMASKTFDFLFIFYTPDTLTNARDTRREVSKRHPKCQVELHRYPDPGREDVSSLVKHLSRTVSEVMQISRGADNHVCMSSGTAEARAALFLLVAAGVLPAALLHLGSPAERLFEPPKIKEVHLNLPGGAIQRGRGTQPHYPDGGTEVLEAELRSASNAGFSELQDALRDLNICISSSTMRVAAEQVAKAAPTGATILILGESGTGKELFARLAHRLSERSDRDFIPINCAEIPTHLAEDKLFGHVKGGFTDAKKDVKGQFELADKGTLFLDELCELNLEVQKKLLRVLDQNEVMRVGAERPRKVDVRVIAATNKNIQAAMAEGQFRQDLYHRLSVLIVRLPPLRERQGEFDSLAVRLLDSANQEFGKKKELSPDSISRLKQHSWPGNVRELKNVLRRTVPGSP